MSDEGNIVAGECTTELPDNTPTFSGGVVVLVKPDHSILVHDADGFLTIAWCSHTPSLTVEVRRRPSPHEMARYSCA